MTWIKFSSDRSRVASVIAYEPDLVSLRDDTLFSVSREREVEVAVDIGVGVGVGVVADIDVDGDVVADGVGEGVGLRAGGVDNGVGSEGEDEVPVGLTGCLIVGSEFTCGAFITSQT
jgi:hypothetical protein